MLYKVALIFESVDEILKCDHSNESFEALLSCGAVCFSFRPNLRSNFYSGTLRWQSVIPQWHTFMLMESGVGVHNSLPVV